MHGAAGCAQQVGCPPPVARAVDALDAPEQRGPHGLLVLRHVEGALRREARPAERVAILHAATRLGLGLGKGEAAEHGDHGHAWLG